MKIGIITIIDNSNYGNRLQNYATQQVLTSLGHDVETIVNNPSNKVNLIKKIQFKINSYKIKSKYREMNQMKMQNFKTFTNRYIKQSSFVIYPNELPINTLQLYDIFVAGSDQIWNPIFRKGSSIDFLTFAPPGKRIAYAPSFGVSEIPIDYQKNYKKWITEFKSLSVREDTGAKIIRDLTGREASIIVDPTVMLSKEEWLSIAISAENKPVKPFLLTYFLGEIPKEVLKLIEQLSKEKDLEVINLGSYKQKERYATDPSEFIDYINSAHIFLTDSFHGAVFSIILEKQFIVFNRISKAPSMNSRIDTLLTKFKLMHRKWESVKTSKDYFGGDYSHTGPIFEEEKSKTYEYLRDALNLEDGH